MAEGTRIREKTREMQKGRWNKRAGTKEVGQEKLTKTNTKREEARERKQERRTKRHKMTDGTKQDRERSDNDIYL